MPPFLLAAIRIGRIHIVVVYKVDHLGALPAARKAVPKPSLSRGTEGSNPAPSSGESDELRGSSRNSARYANHECERLWQRQWAWSLYVI